MRMSTNERRASVSPSFLRPANLGRKMRRAVLYLVLIAQASLSGAQQPTTAPQVPNLLEGMRANPRTERSKAFDGALSFLGSNKAPERR